MSEPLELTLVTGFLGSGKTTLIRRFVETAQGADTGIIVNEFGEVGVDHTLFVHATEQIELVDGGCLCCARRADVSQAMYRLVQAARGGTGFKRAILETSGLADPAPIIATLANDAWLRSNVVLRSVVTVVDAIAGVSNIAQQSEARRQISIADTIIVTKRDMRDALEMSEMVRAIRTVSPDAIILDAQEPDFNAGSVISGEHLSKASRKRFFEAQEPVSHREEISSFTIKMDQRVDWPAFTLWLSSLLHAHGDRILRVKGLLNTASAQTRLAIHGVQHVMHPPTHLPGDPDDSESYLVFITRGLERDAIERSLYRMMQWSPAVPFVSDGKPAIVSGTTRREIAQPA